MQKSPFEKMKEYKTQIDEDLKINEINLSEKSFNVPHKKHYWCTRLILETQELFKMERTKKKIEKELSKAKMKDSPIQFSNTSIKSMVNETDTMQKLIQDIEDQKLLVEYLNKVEKIFSYITNDIKNIIEVKQLEQS